MSLPYCGCGAAQLEDVPVYSNHSARYQVHRRCRACGGSNRVDNIDPAYTHLGTQRRRGGLRVGGWTGGVPRDVFQRHYPQGFKPAHESVEEPVEAKSFPRSNLLDLMKEVANTIPYTGGGMRCPCCGEHECAC